MTTSGRIFVDALDSQYYKEHHDLGRCYFVRFQREVFIQVRYLIAACENIESFSYALQGSVQGLYLYFQRFYSTPDD
jgi:hypothetical protein